MTAGASEGDVRVQAGPCTLAIRGASDGDLRQVVGQLGARPTTPDAPADLILEFGPLPRGPRRLLGVGEYAAHDDGLVVLLGPGKRPVEVLVPFEALGPGVTVRCAPGSAPLPLLVHLVNVIGLARGAVTLHAAAFELDGRGVLVTGWAKSGKTETLLAFADRGARYVADEWCSLDADGTLGGLAEPVRLWSWHLDELGARGPRLSWRTRAGLRTLDRVLDAVPVGADTRGWLRRAHALASRQRNVLVPPGRFLAVAEGGAPLDVVVVTESHDRPDITVEPLDPDLAATRAAVMLPVERAPLLAAYDAYRYAFPDRRSDLLETAVARERELLAKRFAGRPALLVRHPYPFRFGAMADALGPHLGASGGRTLPA